jgi:hypothetical protein
VFSGHAHPFLSLSFSPALSGVGGGGGGIVELRAYVLHVCDSGVENASFVLTLCFTTLHRAPWPFSVLTFCQRKKLSFANHHTSYLS